LCGLALLNARSFVQAAEVFFRGASVLEQLCLCLSAKLQWELTSASDDELAERHVSLISTIAEVVQRAAELRVMVGYVNAQHKHQDNLHLDALQAFERAGMLTNARAALRNLAPRLDSAV